MFSYRDVYRYVYPKFPFYFSTTFFGYFRLMTYCNVVSILLGRSCYCYYHHICYFTSTIHYDRNYNNNVMTIIIIMLTVVIVIPSFLVYNHYCGPFSFTLIFIIIIFSWSHDCFCLYYCNDEYISISNIIVIFIIAIIALAGVIIYCMIITDEIIFTTTLFYILTISERGKCSTSSGEEHHPLHCKHLHLH